MTVARDSRDKTLQDLTALVHEALRISLIAQRLARGEDAIAARKTPEFGSPEYLKLVTPDGGSGFLDFQWISEGLLKVITELAKVDLTSFWILVDARSGTQKVYENPLKGALEPLSRIRTSIRSLFEAYPGNKIGVLSLEMLRKLQDTILIIESTIGRLLQLSPPALPSASRKLSWRWVVVALAVALASIPLFYWLNAGGSKVSSEAISARLNEDISEVRRAARSAPSLVPGIIFGDIIPMASNFLLLVSASLTLIRAFSGDSRRDSKQMSEALNEAAATLREVASGGGG